MSFQALSSPLSKSSRIDISATCIDNKSPYCLHQCLQRFPARLTIAHRFLGEVSWQQHLCGLFCPLLRRKTRDDALVRWIFHLFLSRTYQRISSTFSLRDSMTDVPEIISVARSLHIRILRFSLKFHLRLSALALLSIFIFI